MITMTLYLSTGGVNIMRLFEVLQLKHWEQREVLDGVLKKGGPAIPSLCNLQRRKRNK